MTLEEREAYDKWMDLKVRSASYTEADVDVHTWFSLTYSNYLVLHRSLLQSMPMDWQRRFVTAVEQLQAAYAHLEMDDSYEVKVLARHTEYTLQYFECDNCDGNGTLQGENWDHEFDCPECKGEGQVEDPEGYRYETPEEVGFKSDSIPHYNRGRTVVHPFGITPEQYLKEIR